ncbi:PREDICTED: pentatricopeptide repeat-containing protein At4g21190 isoform X2 [Ipomoea nil]|uniref:pentatricopeptide repeat-containing protein At4g21190 isoform X2 n=1 Tax=Ipomoea nil TaxID=35883 RepID=UPI0009012F84|nr:PREDICTED: pentatricopeptide repeat-containing protein At4g21190 isoform X2 [Ipomoea nil]
MNPMLTAQHLLPPWFTPAKAPAHGRNSNRGRMLALRCFPAIFTGRQESSKFWNKSNRNAVVCAAKGPRPRYPRVWKSKRKIGTISKSLKLVECIKGLSNVKEEVYGALDSFIAWELEFPLITVKKAIKTLEHEKEWKRIIQVTKWMLSKGQGRTMGSYHTLLNALAEDGRLDEAEELWRKLLLENLESIPRIFFEKMISLYYRREMHEKMFEIFADMEELGVRPTVRIVTMVGDVFQKLDMLDKYRKLKKKYPPPRWEYRYVKGRRIKIRTDASKCHNYGDVVANESDNETYSKLDENIDGDVVANESDTETYSESDENIEACADRLSENTELCPDKLDEVDMII